MSETMSQPFVLAFLETCFDEGLTEKQASELLQKESVDQELNKRPAFAEGYLSVASKFPGHLQPVMQKEGAALIKGMGTGLRWLGGKMPGRGAGALGAGGAPNWMQRAGAGMQRIGPGFSRGANVGAAASLPVLGFGLNKWLTRNNDLYNFGHSGGVSRDELLARAYDMNSMMPDQDEIARLQAGVDSGSMGGSALQQLQALKKRQEEFDAKRDSYGEELQAKSEEMASIIQRARALQQRKGLDSDRGRTLQDTIAGAMARQADYDEAGLQLHKNMTAAPAPAGTNAGDTYKQMERRFFTPY